MRFNRPPPRLIKKYPNRRLYDTTDSAYITLDELVSRVKGGADVRIVDASTNEDLTQQTLAQMLFDGRGAARFLSVPLLTQLVRLGDDALADFLGRYLSTALDLYVQSRRGAQALAPFNPFATLPFAATESLARLLNGALPWPGGGQAYQQPPRHPLDPYDPYAAQPAPLGSVQPPVAVPAIPMDEPVQAVIDAHVAQESALEAQRDIEVLRAELAALRERVATQEAASAPQQKPAKRRKVSPKEAKK